MAIWHNVHSGKGEEWTELPLTKEPAELVPMEAGRLTTAEKHHRYAFTGELDVKDQRGKHAAFTVKYRVDKEASWQWAKEQFGTKDGELIFEAEPESGQMNGMAARDTLEKYIGELNPALNVEYRRSESPGATIWNLEGKVGPAHDRETAVEGILLGSPTDFVRNVSLVRIWSPFIAPRHGFDTFRLTEDALLVSFLRNDGKHLVLLGVSGIDNVLTVFQSQGDRGVVASVKNDNFHKSTFQVLAAVAPSFDIGISALMYEARRVVGKLDISTAPPEPEFSLQKDGDEAKVQWYAHWYDELGYCTWNGLGQKLTEEKIFNALDTLRASGINVGTLIIDDNWQTLNNEGETQWKSGWVRFEANEEACPNGLKSTVQRIRRENPNIQHVAVWHALLGYWNGICPDGELAKKYKTKVVRKEDRIAGGTMTAIDPDDVYQFYDDFYSFLRSSGVDSVKTDAQYFLDLLADPVDRARFTQPYQDAWAISSLRYFQERTISCMSQAPQIIFHSQIPTNKPRTLLRNSDDFFPEVPSSHAWHIFANAHVTLLTQHLNVVPDWDMFQTVHPYSSFHAAARCVSGGPIYITDEPGKHDTDLINQMTALTTQGKTVILRPSILGRTMDAYHNYNEGQTLKVGAYNGWAGTGSGILGLFNVAEQDASSLISLADFMGVNKDDEYVIRSHTTGVITAPKKLSDKDSLVSVTLEPRGWEILTATPVQSLSMPSSNNPTGIAVLGLLGKMTGAAALLESHISVLENGRLRMNISLKALGTLGIYISCLEQKSVEEDFMVMMLGRPVPVHTVEKRAAVDGGNGVNKVLAIDVQTAWKEMDLKSGWNNEVQVQILMS